VGELLRNGQITLPSSAEIQDKSKSDSLAKALALIQTLWFVIQCIARSIERLPVTELEIVTLGYGAFSFCMFIAWWNKPRNVACPIRVSQQPRKGHEHSNDRLQSLFNAIIGRQDDDVNLHYEPKVPMFYSGEPGDWEILVANGFTLAAGMVFGAIHCIAWAFHFPSHVESLLWRVSSAAIAVVPAPILIVSFVSYKFGILEYLLFVLLVFSGLLYVAARVITVALAFLTLASLPSGAFQTVHWTTSIPHI